MLARRLRMIMQPPVEKYRRHGQGGPSRGKQPQQSRTNGVPVLVMRVVRLPLLLLTVLAVIESAMRCMGCEVYGTWLFRGTHSVADATAPPPRALCPAAAGEARRCA